MGRGRARLVRRDRGAAGSALTSDGDVTSNPESKQAAALIDAELPARADPERDRGRALGSLHGRRARVPGEGAGALASAARRSACVADARKLLRLGRPVARLEGSPRDDGAARDARRRGRSARRAGEAENGQDGFQVSITGSLTADADFEKLSEEDLQKGELLIGLPAALIVLLLVFGAVVAGLVPVLLGLLSIVVAVALTALVGQAFEVSFFVVNMISAMGLALGIDYALFILSRYREERGRGLEKIDAIVASGATASRAVLFSGIAFVLAMFGMLLGARHGPAEPRARRDPRRHRLGARGADAAARRAEPARRPRERAADPVVGRRAIASAGSEGRFWSALVRGVMRRPLVSLVAATALLLGLAASRARDRHGRLGAQHAARPLPVQAGLRRAEPRLPRRLGRPGADRRSRATSPRRRFARRSSSSRRASPARRRSARRRSRCRTSGDVVVLSVPVAGDADGAEAASAIRHLRADLIPQAFGGVEATVLVGGTTAENADYFDIVGSWLPIVFAFVLGLSFILLTVAFRSIVIPAVAIALNLLAVGAAYGLLVLVFQKGVGNELLGFQQVDTVEAWVPLFLFSVLFGLSMDYQVFLLSRIKERYTQTGDTAGAVAFGVGSTARLITGAALIIIAVFGGFAAGDLVMFQQMGFGVAVALLVDATIVRCVLVPASMKLLGERNWYLPSWLNWVPEVHVEGPRHEAQPTRRPSHPTEPIPRADGLGHAPPRRASTQLANERNP